jgi:hypothetical protein
LFWWLILSDKVHNLKITHSFLKYLAVSEGKYSAGATEERTETQIHGKNQAREAN